MYNLDDRPFSDFSQAPKQRVSNTIQGMGTSNEQAAGPLGPSASEQQLNGMLLSKGVEAGGNAIYSGVQAGMDVGAEAAFQAADAAQLAGQGLNAAQTASTLAATGAEGAAAASALGGTAAAGTTAAVGTSALGAGAAAGGTAALAALGPVGAGLIGAKMLGLFNNGTTNVPGYYSGTPSVAGGGKGVGNQSLQPSGGITPTPNVNPMANNVMGNIGQLLTDPSNPGGNNASPMAGGSAPAQGGK